MAGAETLAAAIREIRDRVRARHPQPGDGPGISVPDLMPLVHARDAAEGKVAAIGTVNPRAGGIVNSLIQAAKHLIARALDWHVREQVEFNRNVVACVNAAIEALNETNRSLVELAALRRDAKELKDIRSRWAEWHAHWESRLAATEINLLRNISELQAAYQHRLTLAEGAFRDQVKLQHADFTAALEQTRLAMLDAQSQATAGFWKEVEKARLEYERLIHTELSHLRQRLASLSPQPAAEAASPAVDWMWFAERFRGSEESVRERQRFYVPRFAGCRRVLDLGCGRGEFLTLMREAGIEATGVDSSPAAVAMCRAKGLAAEQADLFAYLNTIAEASLGGVFCAHVVEHLPPALLPEFVRLAASRLDRGGLLVIETPNPECLAIFATHFYLDPTHTRPVPHQLLAFYMREFGLGLIEVEKLAPAVESMPSLAALPGEFQQAFFGALDYAIFGRKVS